MGVTFLCLQHMPYILAYKLQCFTANRDETWGHFSYLKREIIYVQIFSVRQISLWYFVLKNDTVIETLNCCSREFHATKLVTIFWYLNWRI